MIEAGCSAHDLAAVVTRIVGPFAPPASHGDTVDEPCGECAA